MRGEAEVIAAGEVSEFASSMQNMGTIRLLKRFSELAGGRWTGRFVERSCSFHGDSDVLHLLRMSGEYSDEMRRRWKAALPRTLRRWKPDFLAPVLGLACGRPAHAACRKVSCVGEARQAGMKFDGAVAADGILSRKVCSSPLRYPSDLSTAEERTIQIDPEVIAAKHANVILHHLIFCRLGLLGDGMVHYRMC